MTFKKSNRSYDLEKLKDDFDGRRRFLVDFYDEFASGYGTSELDVFDYLRSSGRLIGSRYWKMVDFGLIVDKMLAIYAYYSGEDAQSVQAARWLAFMHSPSVDGWWAAHNTSINAGDQQARADGTFARERKVEQQFINVTVHIVNLIQQFPLPKDPGGNTVGDLAQAYFPQEYTDESTQAALDGMVDLAFHIGGVSSLYTGGQYNAERFMEWLKSDKDLYYEG